MVVGQAVVIPLSGVFQDQDLFFVFDCVCVGSRRRYFNNLSAWNVRFLICSLVESILW
eukprot:XP_001704136.1 Hypothetical protein GL50803_28236 [Giardia lamblia ATCC 50803]